MSPNPPCGVEPAVPRLETLGRDLLATSKRQRWMALARPFVGLAAFATAAYLGARACLHELRKGAPDARLTCEAAATCKRLEGRK